MSQLTVKGNDLGSGAVVLQGPNTNTPRTITLPDGTTTLVGHDTTQTLSNKTLTAPLLTAPFLTNAALESPAQVGEFEYDGHVPYFTPAGVERGMLQAMQYFRLHDNLVGANVSTAQSLFGVGVGLQASKVYQFEALIGLTKSGGATSHTIGFLFDGTATLNSIFGQTVGIGNSINAQDTAADGAAFTQASLVVTTPAIAVAAANFTFRMCGIVSVNAAGTFIPQYKLSAAPGRAYSTRANSFFSIWPVGAAGANTSIGDWS